MDHRRLVPTFMDVGRCRRPVSAACAKVKTGHGHVKIHGTYRSSLTAAVPYGYYSLCI